MRDGDELDLEGADPDAVALLHDLDRNARRAGFRQPPGFKQVRAELRHVDGTAEARPEIDQRAVMILMNMGDDDRLEIALHTFGKADIGHDEVDAWRIRPPERYADIDHQPFLAFGADAIEGAIHADFAKPAKGDEMQLAIQFHQGLSFEDKRSILART